MTFSQFLVKALSRPSEPTKESLMKTSLSPKYHPGYSTSPPPASLLIRARMLLLRVIHPTPWRGVLRQNHSHSVAFGTAAIYSALNPSSPRPLLAPSPWLDSKPALRHRLRPRFSHSLHPRPWASRALPHSQPSRRSSRTFIRSISPSSLLMSFSFSIIWSAARHPDVGGTVGHFL